MCPERRGRGNVNGSFGGPKLKKGRVSQPLVVVVEREGIEDMRPLDVVCRAVMAWRQFASLSSSHAKSKSSRPDRIGYSTAFATHPSTGFM